MIAALLVIAVIQCLAMRDKRRAEKTGELEEGIVQTTSDEVSGLDSKGPRVTAGSVEEVGLDDEKKF